MSTPANSKALRGREAFFHDLMLIPNLLCFYRLIGISVAALIFTLGYPIVAVIIGITAGLTDYLDGYLARKWDQCTELGALLDGASDLLFAFVSILIAVLYDVWPVHIFLLWGMRDISITFMRASAGQQGFTIQSSYVGKVASNFNFYSFVVMVIDFAGPFGHMSTTGNIIHWVGLIGIHVGVGLQWVSGATYIRSYIEQYSSQALGNADQTTNQEPSTVSD